MSVKPKKKKKKRFLPLLLVLLLLVILGVSAGVYFKSEFDEIVDIKNDISSAEQFDNADEDLDTNFLKSLVPDADSNVKVVHVSESSVLPDYEFDTDAGKYVKRIYSGRRINIAITGVDSRLGDRFKHADANHIVSILLDSGKIEIISIPRDTPADAGFDDTTGQNKLTIVRANRGRNSYFKELCRIGEVDKIHYYAELGFSQAMGILEWLGFSKPNETLQILRSRSALGGDDFQRVYNQGQFIRQMLFKNFSKLDGFMGDVLIGSGLIILDSDLSTAKIKEIMAALKAKNFQSSIDNITVKIRPAFPAKFKLYNFADDNTVKSLSDRVKTYYGKNHSADAGSMDSVDMTSKVYYRLSKLINRAKIDSAKSPQNVIRNLNVFFEQRAWLQISDHNKRLEIRDGFVSLLANAYERKKDTVSAINVRKTAEAEDNLLNKNKFNSGNFNLNLHK